MANNSRKFSNSATSPSHEIVCNFDKLSEKSGYVSSITPVGSGYNSENDADSLTDDNLNHNSLDQENTPSQQSLVNGTYSVCPGTFSELMGHSDSELFEVKKELFNNLQVIGDAEKVINRVLNKLQSLWLNVDDKATIPSLTASSPGEHKLLQLVNLAAFVVKEIEIGWNTLVSRSADASKVTAVEHTNRLLREQLESSRVIQSCLESELKYLEKEKMLLNEEVKELSFQVASNNKPTHLDATKGTPSPHSPDNERTQNKICNTETEQDNVHNESDDPNTYTSTFRKFNYMKQPAKVVLKQECAQQSSTASEDQSITKSTRPSSAIRFIGKISTTNIRKREHDFDSIMNFVRERGNAMDSLNTQMEKYDADFQTLQEEIYQVASEKLELHKAYEGLLKDYNALLKERQSYEGILNLILKEKKGTEDSIHQILETLINKLNAITSEEGPNSRFALLESALHAVQDQNASYRQEITELKCKLNSTEQNHLNFRTEFETNLEKAKGENEELRNTVQTKGEEFIENQKVNQDKYSKLQDLYEVLLSAKAEVDKALAEKEAELTKHQSSLEGIQKGNTRQQKKLQELQKNNNKLTRETQDQKRSIEQMNTVISQLRSNLKEQKIQWTDRVRAASDEATQTKEHCRWLQAQIDHLNHQLAECHERIKTYEKEKTTLAQQVMSAEEERKVVDRKLEELRSALQGDTVLREALMERNEALQIEINRLRRAKLMNIAINKEGDHSEPPSEMNTLDAMSSLASVPPTYYPDKPGKKNRYAAGIASNYPGRDTARNAISAHGSTLSASQGGSPSSLD